MARPFPLSPVDIAAVLAPFDVAVSLPAVAYLDDAVFAHEQATIFRDAWIAAGREEDVEAPGQWMLAPLSPEGVLVVRGADLELRAFHNVCRHRASTLVDGRCGRLQSIQCPYHGWTYDLTGALREAPHEPPGLDRGAHGLVPLRVAVWQGFVLVSASEGAGDVASGAPPWLSGSALGHARRAHEAEYEVRANWKLVVENFQESDHFTRIHPSLERLTPNERASSVLGDGPWLGGTMTFAAGVETVSMSGARNGRPFLAAPPYRQQVHDAILFPTLLTSLQPDYLLTYRLYPRAVDRTFVIAETFVHPAALTADFDARDIVSFWETINREDRAICERQQVGMGSRGYRPTRYSPVEDGVHAFDRLVARSYPQ